MSKPVYCFTFDLDWAAEPLIKYMIDMFKEKDIPLTPFITHKSKVIEEEYKGNMHRVGLHPNFWVKSTHGDTYKNIINHVISLNPKALFFRSHGFYDDTNLTNIFRNNGFKYDSNLALQLQPNITPLKHSSGLIRYPVFFEDDYYLYSQPDFKVKSIKKDLLSDGLKIFNIHPVHIWINSPSIEYYQTLKQRANKGFTREDLRYYDKGIETFTLHLIKFLKNHSCKFYYLKDICEVTFNG